MIIFLFAILFPERIIAPQAIMGSHLSTLNSPLSIFYQPALIPDEFSFAFSYTRPYEGLPLNSFESAFSFPLLKFQWALGFSYFGEDIYKENSLLLGLNYKNSLFSLGTSFKLLSLNIPEVITYNEPTFDLGAVFYFPFDIKIGAFTRNIYRSKKYKGDIPSLFALSFGVTNEALLFFFDFISEENHPFTYSIGFKMPLISSFYLKGGLRSGEKTFGAGFGVSLKFLNLEGFYRVHPFLGYSFALSLSFYKE